MKILWLRPRKSENISVGRQRIALILQERGHEVEVKNAFLSLKSPAPAGFSPDVIIGTTRLGAFIGALEKKKHGTPLVVDHIDPIHQMKERSSWLKYLAAARMEKFAFRNADHVMVVYEDEIPRVRRYSDNVTHTDLGVEYDMFADPAMETIEDARSTIAEKGCSEKKILIYVGGLEPTYNISEMVESMDYLDDEWVLLILGDGSLREYVETADKKRRDVCYLGTVPHEMVPGFMRESDVGISLVDDRNTLKMLEYAAAGLPAVNVEGEAEKRFNRLVKFCEIDPEEVADAVTRAYNNGPGDGFKEVAREHSWESIANEYEEVMKTVLMDGKIK